MNIINSALSAKHVRIHGMSSDKWTTRDKITQYKGLVSLYKRDRDIQEIDTAVDGKRQHKGLQSLRKYIDADRRKLHNAIGGDRQKLRNTLSDHKALQLAQQNSDPKKVIENVQQYNFVKRKVLDRLHYEMSLKSKRLIHLKLEKALLQDRQKYAVHNSIKEEEISKIITGKVQDAILKKQAALEIRQTYTQIIDLMKKDDLYFDRILSTIHNDYWHQCTCVLNATKQGQLATEYQNDREQEFSSLEKAIFQDMKRQRTDLDIVREQTENMHSNLKLLLRRDSDLTTCVLTVEETDDFVDLRQDLNKIESLLTFLKDTTLVNSFEQIYPNLEEQRKQKKRLNAYALQCERNSEIMRRKFAHAELMSSNLRNSMVSTTGEYKKRKKELMELIDEEINQKNWLEGSRQYKCHLLAKVRISLKQVEQLCKPIKLPRDKEKKARSLQTISEEVVTPPEEENNDGHQMIDGIIQKLTFLLNNADVQLDDLKTDAAYKSYELLMRDHSVGTEVHVTYPSPLESHTADAAHILTREDIKQQSDGIVAANTQHDDLALVFPGKKKSKMK